MGLSRGVISLTFQFLLYIRIEGNTEKDQYSGFFFIGHILDSVATQFSHIYLKHLFFSTQYHEMYLILALFQSCLYCSQ